MRRLPGLLAQGMSARKACLTSFIARYDDSSGTNSFTARTDCVAFIFATGGGGGSSDANVKGGGGGAAGHKVQFLAAGQTLSWSVATATSTPTDGDDSTVTLPGGAVLKAGGGQCRTSGGAGGQCSGPWDIARKGGDGGISGVNGESPVGGGTGGNGGATGGGGGGSAGFSDLYTGIPTGNGGSTNFGIPNNSAPGGGGGAAGSPSAVQGTAGRVIVIVMRVAL